jgi:hypothetical protein
MKVFSTTLRPLFTDAGFFSAFSTSGTNLAAETGDWLKDRRVGVGKLWHGDWQYGVAALQFTTSNSAL